MTTTPEEALEQAALAGVHRIGVPTPFAVGKVNAYLIEDDPLTLIDTGPNYARGLDALTLGEEGARSLGISVTRLRWAMALGVALTAGASVAVTGVVSFVGLIVPHLLRPLVGSRPGGLLISSALGGAALVLAADILVRLTPAAGEVKLGVAMAILGGPFFFFLLLSMRRRLA